MKRLLPLLLLLLFACTGQGGEGAPCEHSRECKQDWFCKEGSCRLSMAPQPLAIVGNNRSVGTGQTVALDGSRSVSVTGQKLRFLWTLTSPAGSKSRLRNRNQSKTSFQPDIPGDYKLRLVVEDGFVSQPALLTIAARKIFQPPNPEVGRDRVILWQKTATLDASASNDPDGDNLNFRWKLLRRPTGSKNKLIGSNTAIASFVPDVVGLYVAEVSIKDGHFTRTRSLVLTCVKTAPAPVLHKSSQTSLPLETQSRLLLTGQHFLVGARVLLGTLEARQVQVRSPGELEVLFDLRQQTAGTRTLVVLNPDGQRSSPLSIELKQAPAPTLSAMSEKWIFVQQTIELKLKGTGFLPGAQVFWDNKALPATTLSDKEVRVQFRAETIGTVKLRVQNPDGQQSTTLSLEIVGISALVTELSPPQVLLDKNRVLQLTVRGYNFVRGARVRFSNGATIRWASLPLVVTSERMTATLSLKDFRSSVWQVDVINPASKAGNSVRFEILAP